MWTRDANTALAMAVQPTPVTTGKKRRLVAKVKCCGKLHDVVLIEGPPQAAPGNVHARAYDTILLPSHAGVHAAAAASVVALGGKVRCVEIANAWTKVVSGPSTLTGSGAVALRALPDLFQRRWNRGFDNAFNWQQRHTTEARREKRKAHAEEKIKELDRRIKRLTTARKSWLGKLRRLAKQTEVGQ